MIYDDLVDGQGHRTTKFLSKTQQVVTGCPQTKRTFAVDTTYHSFFRPPLVELSIREAGGKADSGEDSVRAW